MVKHHSMHPQSLIPHEHTQKKLTGVGALVGLGVGDWGEQFNVSSDYENKKILHMRKYFIWTILTGVGALVGLDVGACLKGSLISSLQ
jgi:hypothetical protein